MQVYCGIDTHLSLSCCLLVGHWNVTSNSGLDDELNNIYKMNDAFQLV